MDNFQTIYQSKLTNAEEAVKIVKSGDWLEYTLGPNMPEILDEALAARAEELEDINVRVLLGAKPLKIIDANDRVGRNVFTINSWHFSGYERQWAKKGYAFYLPFRYSECPEMYRREEDIERVDVMLVQTAPMDKYGYFNFGPSNSHLMEAARRAKHIIVEVNENMPYINGLYDEALHISQVDKIVEHNSDLVAIGNAKPNATDEKIAELILKEIPNGATLQLGIGGMPNAVGAMIAKSDLKDLGIHSEMYVDSMMDMTKAGVITGQRKNLDRGKQVFAFAMGSNEMYEFMDHNPQIVSAPVDYVNSPNVIEQFDNFISINNAIEVDLFGQVSSESVGFRQISGTGGQLDFVIGAYHSKGGKSFVALTSSFLDKKGVNHSRIVPFINQSRVTDPYTTTHYIVTEYGMLNLKGKSLWQRSEGLINLAHPDFRDELIAAAEVQGIWLQSNKR
ncbi:MAG: butyryl-CoA:acetate CoA-transferase [Clostridiaceae bacterium]|nr:butyryl-CoA:acetate CoA-transferase [Clostridiaceae bacterium]